MLLFECLGKMGRVDKTAAGADFLDAEVRSRKKLASLFQLYVSQMSTGGNPEMLTKER